MPPDDLTRAAPPTIRLGAQDDVVIARTRIPAGTTIAAEGLTTQSDIPAGHKIATRDIAAGAPVRRYGQIIGFATFLAQGRYKLFK